MHVPFVPYLIPLTSRLAILVYMSGRSTNPHTHLIDPPLPEDRASSVIAIERECTNNNIVRNREAAKVSLMRLAFPTLALATPHPRRRAFSQEIHSTQNPTPLHTTNQHSQSNPNGSTSSSAKEFSRECRDWKIIPCIRTRLDARFAYHAVAFPGLP
jgi:hypothetical protein